MIWPGQREVEVDSKYGQLDPLEVAPIYSGVPCPLFPEKKETKEKGKFLMHPGRYTSAKDTEPSSALLAED